MKYYKQILFFILIVFFKTETLLSENNLFNVNNIEIEKKNKITHSILADRAIKKGFEQLISKILLKQDIDKLTSLSLKSIKQLVTYYQISSISNEDNKEVLNFSITFDKDKIHNLFYQKGISYSEISDKELYTLPVLIKNSEIFIFNNNFYYKNWNDISKKTLIDFILPLENIELIQSITSNRNSLINLNLNNLFKEYPNKNLALILIEENNKVDAKIYIKSKIQEKVVSKNLILKRGNLDQDEFNERIIVELKKELTNLVKSKNLIDIRTPSFINAKLILSKKNNLVELNSRIKNIDPIENIYIQEFNKDYVSIRIKYLGGLEKIINQLKRENINLKLINDSWIIKML